MKLTDKEKKKIIAVYTETQNYSETARITGTSRTTITRLLKKSPELVEKLQEKKEENTKDILKFLDRKKNKACDVIDLLLSALLDKEKVSKAPLAQIGTALGIVIDKFTRDNGGISSEDKPKLEITIKDCRKNESNDTE